MSSTSSPDSSPAGQPSYLIWGLILAVAALGLVLWTQRGRFSDGGPKLVPATQVLKLYGEPQQLVPDPAQSEQVRSGRIQLQRTQERMMQAVDRSDPRATRNAEREILTDVRDGWLAAHGTQFAVDLPSDVTGTLRVDIGLLYNNVLEQNGVALPDGLQMKFSVGLVDGDGMPRPIVGQVVTADYETLAWQPLSCPLSTREMTSPKLVFQSLMVGADPSQLSVELVQNIMACWANPMLVRERPSAPNVVLLSIDTLRADHLGCYGYERDTSPNIDKLLERGVIFENAISGAPWTLPSYGTLFTGRYPSSHRAGVRPVLNELWGSDKCGEPLEMSLAPRARQTRTLAKRYVTLAEALRDQGYRTAGLVNNPFLHPSRDIDQGFERYAWYQHTADDGVDEALTWIDEQAGVPFFLFLHLMDPHMPYAPPEPFDERFSGQKLTEVDAAYPWTLGHLRADPNPESWKQLLIDMYDGEIAYTDQEVGRFVAELERRGLMDNTILILHSDHGEEFWDHGSYEHGHSLHKELLHVPLAIVYPKSIPAGTRVSARVRTADVYPTVLDLLGLPPEIGELEWGRLAGDGATLNARSLMPWVTGEREDPLDTLSEAMLYGPPEAGFHEQKARYEGGFKLIVGGQMPTNELYDVEADPGETNNILMDNWETARSLLDRLIDSAMTLTKESPESGAARPSAEQIELMKAVGYTGMDEPAEDEEGEQQEGEPAEEDDGEQQEGEPAEEDDGEQEDG